MCSPLELVVYNIFSITEAKKKETEPLLATKVQKQDRKDLIF
jgi:hypothetical protein